MKVPEIVRDAMHRAVLDDADIDGEFLRSAFDNLLRVQDVRIRAALCATLSTVLLQRGPRAHEVTALWQVLIDQDELRETRPYAAPLPGRGSVVTVMGSGKKGARCLNISTPSALLACAAGAAVAKIGANCTSRITSSLELIQLLGVNLDLGQDAMMKALETTGFGYFRGGDAIAPRFFETYKGTCVAPHALMFGWPMVAPIRSDGLVYGLAHWNVRVAGEVMRRLGTPHREIVIVSARSDDTLFDEALPFGTTYSCRIADGEFTDAAQHRFGIELRRARDERIERAGHGIGELAARGSAADDVATTVAALSGRANPTYSDTLALNAALILRAGGVADDLREGFTTCRSLLASGATIDKLHEIVDATGGDRRVIERLQ